MIDVTELRIGNIIRHDCNQWLTIVEIRAVYNRQLVRVKYTRTDTYEPHNSLIPGEDCNYINLTPEILQNFNWQNKPYFICGNDWQYENYIWSENGWLQQRTGENEAIIIAKGVFALHRLQNIFYALQGKEVNVEL